MTDWEEVKRLAADFQKVQLSSTTQKLSERNCVEIVSWLIDKKIIDLIFTSDGKEYLTPSQLVTDIQNELYVSGGRINLADLAKIIGVDYGHINAHLNEIVKGRKDIQVVLGQLIDLSYITKIAGEINEKLQQLGQINVGDLTISYDLPAEFLQQQVIEKHLGTIILGQQDKNDPKVFFTESYIARCRAKVRGALAGITRPIPIVSILNHIGVNEKLFFSLFDQTCMYGTLTNKLAGAQYIPNCYARSQNDWATSFYKQNGYLEFDALTRIGISDPKTYLKKQFGNDLLFLESSVASSGILERLEADIDECIRSKSYVDLQNSLPSVFTSKDISLIIDKLLTGSKRQQTVVIEDFVISKTFIDQISEICEESLKEKAIQIVESGKYQQYITSVQSSQSKLQKVEELEEKVDKREERRKKAAGGKTGGGTQGRETKAKSTKKHSRGGNKGDSFDDDDIAPETKKLLAVITEDDIKELIRGTLEEEGLDSLLDTMSKYLLQNLNERGLQMAAEIFQSRVVDQNATRRKTHNELQEKINDLVGEVRLFAKGTKLLPGDVQTQLTKYLLKTICSDIVTEILNYVAAETLSNVQVDNYNNDQKLKFINELPNEYKAVLQPLVKSLSGQSVEEFMMVVESALVPCSMILKKVDKKKDRTTVLNHKHKLLEELDVCEDLALILHLATLVLFISSTQCMVHASGRHVSNILAFLKQSLNESQFSELMSYYDFVTLMLSNGSEAENAKEKLKEKVEIVKSIAHEFKPCGSEKSVHN